MPESTLMARYVHVYNVHLCTYTAGHQGEERALSKFEYTIPMTQNIKVWLMWVFSPCLDPRSHTLLDIIYCDVWECVGILTSGITSTLVFRFGVCQACPDACRLLHHAHWLHPATSSSTLVAGWMDELLLLRPPTPAPEHTGWGLGEMRQPLLFVETTM